MVPRILKVVVLFAVAGYLSAAAFVSYSARVEKLYKALPSQYAAPGVDSRAAFNNWYRANAALTPYADRKWPILCLGFPVAMTLASLLAKKAGWLRIGFEQLLPGLVPPYFAPVLVFFLSGVSWFLLFFPALGLAAGLLALSLRLVTSKRPTWFFLGFLIAVAFCAVLGFRVYSWQGRTTTDTVWNVFFISLEVIWGGIFGWGLAVAVGRPQSRQSVESGLTRG